MSSIAPAKDAENQTPVPCEWRATFSEIVEAFKGGDFRLARRRVVGVKQISEADAVRIERNIRSYGAELTSLPQTAWDTSVCQWMGGYWDVLVDLFTTQEGASDLVLVARVYEEGDWYAFDVQSVHVP